MNGFLGTRGSFMLDLVVTGMLASIPLMFLSVWMARAMRRYDIHKRLQLVLAAILLFIVIAFELEMRICGWTARAVESPFWREGRFNDWIDYVLAVHLCFAIPTPVIWGIVIYNAVRKFPQPPEPAEHSRFHRRWGQLAAASMTATAITGWAFYYLAFAA